MTICNLTPESLPLDKWPDAAVTARWLFLAPGDYTSRGKLTINQFGTTVRGSHHGSAGNAPRLQGIDVRADGVDIDGVRFDRGITIWSRSHCRINRCATYGGVLRLIGDSAHNTVSNNLFHRLVDVGGDMPAIIIDANWRLRYSDKSYWADIGSPENDWYPTKAWFNLIENNVVLNYVDGISPAAIGNSGWLPWRGSAKGTVVRENVFGVTSDFLTSDGEWPGENIMCDCKSGGTEEYPLVFVNNFTFGQRKSSANNICAAVTIHIGATNILFDGNTWADCDSVAAVAFARHIDSTESGSWDTTDGNIRFRNSVYWNIRRTSESDNDRYRSIAGTVFSQGGAIHSESDTFVDCQRLASEYGRFVPSTFTGGQVLSQQRLMSTDPNSGRPAPWVPHSHLGPQPIRIVMSDFSVPWTTIKAVRPIATR